MRSVGVPARAWTASERFLSAGSTEPTPAGGPATAGAAVEARNTKATEIANVRINVTVEHLRNLSCICRTKREGKRNANQNSEIDGMRFGTLRSRRIILGPADGQEGTRWRPRSSTERSLSVHSHAGPLSIQVFRRYLPIGDPIEEMLTESRRQIDPPNLRHQSPNVIRASSSFSRSRSAESRDSVSRFTSEKNRSFSASLD